MDKIDLFNRAMRTLPTILPVLLTLAGLIAPLSPAGADTCRFTTCGARERMLGTTPLYREPGRGNPNYYNPRNVQLPTIKAKPFDLRSPTNPKKPGDYVIDNPNVNNEHRRWCRQHYRSYDGISDTYTTFDGRTRTCDSPYD